MNVQPCRYCIFLYTVLSSSYSYRLSLSFGSSRQMLDVQMDAGVKDAKMSMAEREV